ncbi:MAG: hypothetical protein KDD33_11855 [Bdellovibrionales bacterium]|nr:hypothetical protein [Bdellovibrionales bacterium]
MNNGIIIILSTALLGFSALAESNVNSGASCQQAIQQFTNECNPLNVYMSEADIRNVSSKCKKGNKNKSVRILESTKKGARNCQVIEERADGTRHITRYMDGGIKTVLVINPDKTQKLFYYGQNGLLANRNGSWNFYPSHGGVYQLSNPPSRDELNSFIEGGAFTAYTPSVPQNDAGRSAVNN